MDETTKSILKDTIEINNAVKKAKNRITEYKNKPVPLNGKLLSTRKVHPSSSPSKEIWDGPRLLLKILRAEGLCAVDIKERTSDTICIITLGTERHRTSVKLKTINPIWNEEFLFGETQSIIEILENLQLNKTFNTFIQISVHDVNQIPTKGYEINKRKNSIENDQNNLNSIHYTNIGNFTIPLNGIINNRYPPQWFPLKPPKNKSNMMLNNHLNYGFILCSIRLVGMPKIFSFEKKMKKNFTSTNDIDIWNTSLPRSPKKSPFKIQNNQNIIKEKETKRIDNLKLDTSHNVPNYKLHFDLDDYPQKNTFDLIHPKQASINFQNETKETNDLDNFTIINQPSDEKLILRKINNFFKSGDIDNGFIIALESENINLLIYVIKENQPICLSTFSIWTLNLLFSAIVHILITYPMYHMDTIPWIFYLIENDKLIENINPKIIHLMLEKLFELSFLSDEMGVYAAKLHYELKKLVIE